MRQRILEPEWLDHLPPDEPAAVRSRADLRRINFLMGNERWILQALARFPAAVSRGVDEWGAGDGGLLVKIARAFPEAGMAAFDLAPEPRFPLEVVGRIAWHQGDLFAAPSGRGGVLVANLFLHHFADSQLGDLGRRCADYDVLVFNEPDRAPLPLALGTLMHPLVNAVTRHDMQASIRAGFRRGEIQHLMGLETGLWQIQETSTWRGARRVVAWRT